MEEATSQTGDGLGSVDLGQLVGLDEGRLEAIGRVLQAQAEVLDRQRALAQAETGVRLVQGYLDLAGNLCGKLIDAWAKNQEAKLAFLESKVNSVDGKLTLKADLAL